MPEIVLNRNERLALRAAATALRPVVRLGSQGLTDAVLGEINRALDDHELVKVRVPSDDAEERQDFFVEIADRLSCARVQKIGKTLIFWRHNPEKAAKEKAVEAKRERAQKKRKSPDDPRTHRKIRAGARDRVTKRANFSRDS